ncbi:hypothetical protein [Streptomyces sp. NPDC001948]
MTTGTAAADTFRRGRSRTPTPWPFPYADTVAVPVRRRHEAVPPAAA